MKKKNIIKTLLTAWLLLLVLCVAGTPAEAKKKKKAKAYKTKTVKVTKGKTKTVKTSKKIKKVKISSKNKNFKVKKTAAKKFKVSGTDVGKTQTVKVTYTNKNTQTFKIKTVKAATNKAGTYKKKVIAELKSLMADPDKGLRKTLADKKTKAEAQGGAKYTGTYVLHVYNKNGSIGKLTVDEVIKKYSASQKKALILEAYCTNRMTYSTVNGGDYYKAYDVNKYDNREGEEINYKRLYNGTFKGVCSDGAKMAANVGTALGLKAFTVECREMDHEWCCVKVTDKAGNSYWQGIFATSFAYNMKRMPGEFETYDTLKKVEKYKYNPEYMRWKYTETDKKPSVIRTPAPTKAPVVTQSSVQPTVAPPVESTQTPEQRIVIPYTEHGYMCAGCNPLNPPPCRHTDSSKPYMTNSKASYGGITVYKHVTGTEVRYFDSEWNEYIDINHSGSIADELVTLAAG